MKPKYSVEQILEAIEASHLPLIVRSVDGDKVELDLLYQAGTVAVVSDENGLLNLHSPVRCYTEWEKVVMSSLQTALRILFDK